MGLLKFLFISILILWLLKMLVKFLLPYFFQKMVKKAQQQAGNPHSHHDKRQQQRRPAGKLSIDYIPPKDKEARAADKAGDFVDFEEIKETKF